MYSSCKSEKASFRCIVTCRNASSSQLRHTRTGHSQTIHVQATLDIPAHTGFVGVYIPQWCVLKHSACRHAKVCSFSECVQLHGPDHSTSGLCALCQALLVWLL